MRLFGKRFRFNVTRMHTAEDLRITATGSGKNGTSCHVVACSAYCRRAEGSVSRAQ